MRISKICLTIFAFQFIALGAFAQSLQSSAPSQSRFKTGMNHVQVKKSPTYYNKIEPAAGPKTAKQLTVPQQIEEREQSALEKKVWQKYEMLTGKGKANAQASRNHLSITTPEQAKAKTAVQKKTINPSVPNKNGGIAGLLKKYEERKAARGTVRSLGLEN